MSSDLEWETIPSKRYVRGNYPQDDLCSIYTYPTHHYYVCNIGVPNYPYAIYWEIEIECSCKPHFLRKDTISLPIAQGITKRTVTIGCNNCRRPVFRVVLHRYGDVNVEMQKPV